MSDASAIAASITIGVKAYVQFLFYAFLDAAATGFCLAMLAPWVLLLVALGRELVHALSPKHSLTAPVLPIQCVTLEIPQFPAPASKGTFAHLATWPAALFVVTAALVLGRNLPPWQCMWLSAFAIFLGVKWLTWCSAPRGARKHFSRSLAYFLLWPGMDARAFLLGTAPTKPNAKRFLWPPIKIAIGIALLWVIPRHIPAAFPLLRGWSGLFGLVLLLHFGSFELLALFWQRFGINAKPIMQEPLSSRSLSEFWGKRWNLGFRQLSHEFIFGPLVDRIGAPAASLLVFLFSGLIHELVISVPARAGYGLPTLYFFLQGAGVALERSSLGRALSLRRGISGWAFAAAVTALPAFWLFHPLFVLRVVIPFMEAIKSL